jgi:lipopolysaccharide biosynthesis protein
LSSNSDPTIETATKVQPPKARAIAFYLPQFHPIPENDAWWGKGFTEWTNVTKAKPLFPGHYQPHLPADLGFYDLRVPETRIVQAEMARDHGIEGFCYYHYWFAGKQLLERPFNEVLKSGEPDFPFCLCWANETWSGIWYGAPERILMKQTYPGPEDDAAHFYTLLGAFSDERYIKVDGKPLFVIYAPFDLPDCRRTTDLWRELTQKAGLKGLYLVGLQNEPWIPTDFGFDGASIKNLSSAYKSETGQLWRVKKAYRKLHGYPTQIYSYKKSLPYFLMHEAANLNMYPAVIPNWDNTPRTGRKGLVLLGSTPELFGVHLRSCIKEVIHKPFEHRIIFIKSWNEWGEGNYLEPDLRYGRAYLEVLRKQLLDDCD